MTMMIVYFLTLLVMLVSIFVSLYFKYELERMFREEEDVGAFHLANLLIVFMVSFAAYGVMTVYVSKEDFRYLRSAAVLFLVILPIYYIGHRLFKKHKHTYQVYRMSEDEKVIVLNEKYLQKKRSPIFREYNATAKTDEGKDRPKRRRF